jgi:hypothetical protein
MKDYQFANLVRTIKKRRNTYNRISITAKCAESNLDVLPPILIKYIFAFMGEYVAPQKLVCRSWDKCFVTDQTAMSRVLMWHHFNIPVPPLKPLRCIFECECAGYCMMNPDQEFAAVLFDNCPEHRADQVFVPF